MDSFKSIGDAMNALVAFDRAKFSTMPEHIQKVMNDVAGVGISPVDRIVKTGEMLFANRELLTTVDDKLMVARLISFAALNGWHGLNEDNRADRIQRTMEVAAKVRGVTIAEKDVPASRDEYLAQTREPLSPDLPQATTSKS